MAKLTQEQLLEIFHTLKTIVKPYEKGVVTPHIDIEGKYDLWAHRPALVQGRQHNEFSFVSIILQSNYVGFYFMPIYTNPPEVTPLISPNLLKHLKGKSCFHIKKVDAELLKDVKAAMKVGYAQYKKNGWV
ncbi:MAG: DUF1801 domain-containing protein [Chitinophagaceae bacterium]|nr:DUF1801 domain-containing protein [Chitinophagaceae bacterium]